MQSWTLSPTTQKLVEERQKHIIFPQRCSTRGGTLLFTDHAKRKAREDVLFVQALGVYLFAGVFKTDEQSELFAEVLQCLKDLFTTRIKSSHFKRRKHHSVRVLRRYEQLFPPTELYCLLHVAFKHMYDQILENGPLIDCFGFERFVGWTIRYILCSCTVILFAIL